MNMLNFTQTIVCTAIGTTVGLTMGSSLGPTQDLVQTKRLVVVDEKDKPVVTISSLGIVVEGQNEGEKAILLRGGLGFLQLRFVKNYQVRASMGLYERQVAGMATFFEGQLRSFFFSDPTKADVCLTGDEDPREPWEMFGGQSDGIGSVRVSAKEGSSEIRLSAKDKPTKSITSISGN